VIYASVQKGAIIEEKRAEQINKTKNRIEGEEKNTK